MRAHDPLTFGILAGLAVFALALAAVVIGGVIAGVMGVEHAAPPPPPPNPSKRKPRHP